MVRVISVVSVFLGWLGASVALGQPARPATGDASGTLTRVDRGADVAPDRLEAALVESGVLARLRAGETLRFFGASFAAAQDATVFLGASADVVHAACLKGEIRAGEATAAAGQLLVWQPGGEKAAASDFEVARFLATSSAILPPDLQRSLGEIAERQKSRIFWGALERVGRNARALAPPALEPTRRDYLRRPSVVELRLRHKTAADLARATAERFVKALVDGDAETAADLLSPALFVRDGDSFASGDWRRHRSAFAAELVRQGWRGRIDAAKLAATETANVWYVSGAPTGFAITLGAFDAMTFVTSVEPQPAPPPAREKVS